MDEPSLFPEGPTPEEHVKKQNGQDEVYSAVSKSITTLGSRLRVLEEQYTNLRNKSQLAEGNMLDFKKDVNLDLKGLSEDILDLKRTVSSLKEKIEIVNSELGSSVKEHEFKVLEKYIDLWNPGHFVTKKELREKFEKL